MNSERTSLGIASVALTAALAACSSGPATTDSGDALLATPIQAAADGTTIAFAGSDRGTACALEGDSITLSSQRGTSGEIPPLVVSYVSSGTAHSDVVTVVADAGTLGLDASGVYSLVPPGADPAWNDGTDLDPAGTQLEGASGAQLSISAPAAGRYALRATGPDHREIFAATAIPHAGSLELEHVAITSGATSYAVHATRTCTPSSNAADAQAALASVSKNLER